MKVIQVGMLGCGTEGTGVARILLENKDHINALGNERDRYKRLIELLVKQCAISDIGTKLLEANLDNFKSNKGS